MKNIVRALATVVIGASVVFSSPSRANTITYDFTGTLTKVTDTNGVLAANNPSLAVGSPFEIIFSFDDTMPSTRGNGTTASSWWGVDHGSPPHSTIELIVGSSSWTTVGNERVDAVYDWPSPSLGEGGPYQQIDSDHTGSLTTNVDPGSITNSQLVWVVANGATLNLGPPGANYLNWNLDTSTTYYDAALTPFNFPLSLDPSQWETSGMFLDVEQNGASYYLAGILTGNVPEPPVSWLLIPGVLLAASFRKRCLGSRASSSFY